MNGDCRTRGRWADQDRSVRRRAALPPLLAVAALLLAGCDSSPERLDPAEQQMLEQVREREDPASRAVTEPPPPAPETYAE